MRSRPVIRRALLVTLILSIAVLPVAAQARRARQHLRPRPWLRRTSRPEGPGTPRARRRRVRRGEDRRGRGVRAAAREQEPARPGRRALPPVGARAARRANWPPEGTGARRGTHHPQGRHRRGVGRSDARRHDLQRDQELRLDGRRPRLRPRPLARRERTGIGVSAHPGVRIGAQSDHHVGSPPQADVRLGRDVVGQARLGRPPAGRAVHVDDAAAHMRPGRSTSTTTSA